MPIETNEKFIDEVRHTAKKLRKAQKYVKETMTPEQYEVIDNDIRSAYTLLEAIVDSHVNGVNARGRVIKRENEETGDMHTHVLTTSFCISNEWLGAQE
jgi:hypothetical protein